MRFTSTHMLMFAHDSSFQPYSKMAGNKNLFKVCINHSISNICGLPNQVNKKNHVKNPGMVEDGKSR